MRGARTRTSHSSALLTKLALLTTLSSILGYSPSASLEFRRTKGFESRRERQLLSSRRFCANTNDDGCWNDLLHDFCGDFDNYEQVLDDRRSGLLPKEGGGHEQIHCTLIPLTSTTRLAAFYFDGMPQKIFRFRYYELEIASSTCVTMKLYTLSPQLEQKLRAASDATTWPDMFTSYEESTRDDTDGQPLIQELPKCDVQWSREMDPVQHKYALNHQSDNDGFHAVMVYGQALVESTMLPGQDILIRDQLSLWQDEFWIHDRGYNPDTGAYIYGNQRGIPYQLKRVTRIDSNGTRRVLNPNLQWTLGPEWRTEEEYHVRLASLGGVSTRLNSG